ncbi:MAG: glutathione S-transferase N-terminal domain-containing protein [Hyphomonas sp.]
MSDYTLYGSEVSLYTGKARAYLRWRGVAFDEVLATKEVYRDVIMPSVGWPVVPVVAMPDGAIVQDTADIISQIEAAEARVPAALPDGAQLKLAARLIELFADEWMVIPAMHYRWNYNEDWAYGEFGRMSAPDKSPAEQYAIGKANGERFRGATPMLGATVATIPGVEAAYEAFLRDFTAHLEQHDFALGARASQADFALNGPLYAHLLRDPESGRIMEKLAPKVADYVRRVQAGEGKAGDLVADDAVPETLAPIFRRQMEEQMPVLVRTAALYETWSAEEPSGANVPRGFGMVDFQTGGFEGECMARSFPLWRLQAVTDVIDGMSAAEKSVAAQWLESVGGSPLMDFRLSRPIVRENCRLKLA